MYMEDATYNFLFKGVSVDDDNVQVSHFFYVDDAIFFGEWDAKNI